MPYHIESDNPECQGFAVVKDDDLEVMGCHRTETQALRQIAALYAAEEDMEDDEDDEDDDFEDDLEGRAAPYTPTQQMAEEAQQGLDWRAEFNRGGTEVGVARARDIINRRNFTEETIRRTVSFFARHEIDRDAEGFRQGERGYPSAGRIAWALWGGDAGRTWANQQLKEIEAEQNRSHGKRRKEVEKILADLRAVR
jgi:hypothetical protein